MQTTQYIGLKKPEGTDVVDIGVLNDNADVIDGEMKKQRNVLTVVLTAAGWSGSAAPFTQTVNVSGAAADMEPVLVSALADGADPAVQKAYSKAFGIISSGTAALGEGTATFKVYKKPTVDCTVGLKGV